MINHPRIHAALFACSARNHSFCDLLSLLAGNPVFHARIAKGAEGDRWSNREKPKARNADPASMIEHLLRVFVS